MIHCQEPWIYPRFYAYCACGLVSPLRRTEAAARADDKAHAEVCREKRP